VLGDAAGRASGHRGSSRFRSLAVAAAFSLSSCGRCLVGLPTGIGGHGRWRGCRGGSVGNATSRTIRRWGSVVKGKTQDVVVVRGERPLDVVVSWFSCSSTFRAWLSTLAGWCSTGSRGFVHGPRGVVHRIPTRTSVRFGASSPVRAAGRAGAGRGRAAPPGRGRAAPGPCRAGRAAPGPAAAGCWAASPRQARRPVAAGFSPGDRYGRWLAESRQDSHLVTSLTSNRPKSGGRKLRSAISLWG